MSPTASPRNYPPPARGWYALSVLVLAYICSFVDRTILTLLVEPIKVTLGISDVQISLLHGLAFAVFYTLLGIPIARLADRHRRTTIISIGIVVWSFMTAFCGTARTFGQLFVARVGVGVGEAALSPAAYSILADYFPPHRLTLALSLYTGAAYIGGGIALVGGGAAIALIPAMDLPIIGAVEPWQSVFFIVGLPGLLVALLMLTVREPPRLGLSAAAIAGRSVPFRHVAQQGRRLKGAYGFLLLAVIAHSMMWNGVVAWMPTFFIRSFGISASTVGVWCGLALMVCGTAGIVAGGFVSTALRQRGRLDANHQLLWWCSVLAIPFGTTMTLVDEAPLALALYGCFLFVASAPYGGIVSAFQEVTPNEMRAQVSAVYQFALNLAGIGLGPTIVALMTDRLWEDEKRLFLSIALMVVVAAPLAAVATWLGRGPYRRALAERQF